MKILLIGGHGKVAMLTHPLLVANGHQVDAVIRNPAHTSDVEATGAQPVVASVEDLDEAATADLVAGYDAVIWSAGAGGGNPARTVAVDRDSAIRTIDAAQRAGVDRFIMVSYYGSGIDDIPSSKPFHTYAAAKAAADDHLRASGLAWTILAPGTLTLGPATGRIATWPEAADGSVPRADVAGVVAAAVQEPGLAGVTLRFNSGDTPIRQALAAVTG